MPPAIYHLLGERIADLLPARELALGAVDLAATGVKQDDRRDLADAVALVRLLAERFADVQADDPGLTGQLVFEPIDDGLRRQRRPSSIRVDEQQSRGAVADRLLDLLPVTDVAPAAAELALDHR